MNDIIKVTKKEDGNYVMIEGSNQMILDGLACIFVALFAQNPTLARFFLDTVNDWREKYDQVEV